MEMMKAEVIRKLRSLRESLIAERNQATTETKWATLDWRINLVNEKITRLEVS